MAAEEKETGLTGLDWVVILATAASMVVLIVWLVQGGPPIPLRRNTPEPKKAD